MSACFYSVPPTHADASSTRRDGIFAETVGTIEQGDELARDHPHVAAALHATDNVVLSGSYAAWRFAPERADFGAMHGSLWLLAFGRDGAERREAFRAAFDALARAACADGSLLCISAGIPVTFTGFGDRRFIRWIITSPSWSRPVTLALSPFASRAELCAGWATCDALGAFVVAAPPPSPRFRVIASNEARAALRNGEVTVTTSTIAPLDAWSRCLLSAYGYTGVPLVDDPRAAFAEDPAIPCGGELAPSTGFNRHVPLTRFYGALTVMARAQNCASLSRHVFGVDFERGTGADRRFRLVSAPDAAPSRFVASANAVDMDCGRSVFDTICLAYANVLANFSDVGAHVVQARK